MNTIRKLLYLKIKLPFRYTKMIPVIEFSGYLSILVTILFIVFRLYYCTYLYNKRLIMEILLISLLTSSIWLGFGMYKKFKPLITQFLVVTLFYVVVLGYMYCMGHHNDKNEIVKV